MRKSEPAGAGGTNEMREVADFEAGDIETGRPRSLRVLDIGQPHPVVIQDLVRCPGLAGIRGVIVKCRIPPARVRGSAEFIGRRAHGDAARKRSQEFGRHVNSSLAIRCSRRTLHWARLPFAWVSNSAGSRAASQHLVARLGDQIRPAERFARGPADTHGVICSADEPRRTFVGAVSRNDRNELSCCCHALQRMEGVLQRRQAGPPPHHRGAR